MKDLGQILTAVITPFDKNGVICTDTFWRLCRKLIKEKSDGLVLSGTTGVLYCKRLIFNYERSWSNSHSCHYTI